MYKMISNVVVKENITADENTKKSKKRIIRSKPEKLDITYDNYFKSGFNLTAYKLQ